MIIIIKIVFFILTSVINVERELRLYNPAAKVGKFREMADTITHIMVKHIEISHESTPFTHLQGTKDGLLNISRI